MSMQKNLIPITVITLLLTACAEQTTSFNNPKTSIPRLPKAFATPYEQAVKNNERANQLSEHNFYLNPLIFSK